MPSTWTSSRRSSATARFDRQATWVFFCEVGLKSAHLAELMQQAGFRAYHVPGGAPELMRRETGGDPLAAQLLSPALLGN